MINETGMVFDQQGSVMLWHEPEGRSSGSLPDSQDLWDFLWKHRIKGDGTGQLCGVAHTHPWHGHAAPSGIDLTTWAAIEKGLGQRLLWPITTFSEVRYFVWNEVVEGYCEVAEKYLHINIEGFDELRRLSGSEESPSE